MMIIVIVDNPSYFLWNSFKDSTAHPESNFIGVPPNPDPLGAEQ